MEYVTVYPTSKKRRIEAVKFITSIVELHQTSKKWLVEWSDKTRTWETYDVIKDLDIFQSFLAGICKKEIRNIPFYIT
jgi:hypothetical protein